MVLKVSYDCKVVTNSQISVKSVTLLQDNKAVHQGHILNIDDKDSIVSTAIALFCSGLILS